MLKITTLEAVMVCIVAWSSVFFGCIILLLRQGTSYYACCRDGKHRENKQSGQIHQKPCPP